MVLSPRASGLSFQHQNGQGWAGRSGEGIISIMARSYTLNSLLELILRDGASELFISSERPPQMVLKNKRVAIGPGNITNDNISNLLYNLATVDQMKELNACGDVRFIYLFRNWARFSIVASMTGTSFTITIKNLGR